MKTKNLVISMLAVFTLALAACGGGQPTTVATDMVEPTDVMATESPMATEEGIATDPAATEEATSQVPVTGDGTISVMEDPSVGTYLVNDAGMALYINKNDTDGVSTCYDDCASMWVPVTSSGDVAASAGEGVDATELGAIERTDGTTQLTFNGWPLYTFANDTQSGDRTGFGMDGMWQLMSPEGLPIDAQSTPQPAATATP